MPQIPKEDVSESPGTRGRLWILTGIVAVVAFLYFVPDLFVAYTEDAYVRSDSWKWRPRSPAWSITSRW